MTPPTMSSKAVLVTGTSAGGIGSAIALSFQKRNFVVFAAVREPAKAAHLAPLPGVHILTMDVTSAASIAAAAQTVQAGTNGKGLDILVNNSGTGYTVPLADANLEQGKKMFEVNFWGVLAVCQAFIPQLAANKGTIVTISSVGGVMATPWIGLYSASKAAATLALETLRLEVGPLGVKVLTVMTGSIQSKFFANLPSFSLPPQSLYTPIKSKIAETAEGKGSPSGTDAHVFANQVIADILGGAAGLVWRGNMANATRYTAALAPTSMMDRLLCKGRGLQELAAAVEKTNGK